MSDAPPSLSFLPLGDRALLVEFGEQPDPAVSDRVSALTAWLDRHPLAGVTDLVPAMCSLALHYDPEAWQGDDPARTPYDRLVSALQAVVPQVPAVPQRVGAVIEIPVVYGGEFGEDLAELARACGLAPEEVVAIHSATVYTVYMLGFAPGFAYLGPLDARLSLPRRDTPRTRVPAGSVAVANAFTAVYPAELPGGWHLIGRTPLTLFDLGRDPPARLAAGNRVRFVPVDAARFHELGAAQ